MSILKGRSNLNKLNGFLQLIFITRMMRFTKINSKYKKPFNNNVSTSRFPQILYKALCQHFCFELFSNLV